jgi:hypothetical protein
MRNAAIGQLGIALCFSALAASCSALGPAPNLSLSTGPQQQAAVISSEHAVFCDKEAKCLEQLHGLASRNGDVLSLRLEGGETKTYEDDSAACNHAGDSCSQTWLVGYLPAHQLFVLCNQGLQARHCSLISRRDGDAATLEAQPHFSPDGNRFLVIAADDSNGRNDVIVFNSGSFPPLREWIYVPKQPRTTYAFLRWEGNNQVRLRESIDKVDHTDIALSHTADGWKLTGPNGEPRLGDASHTATVVTASMADTAPLH